MPKDFPEIQIQAALNDWWTREKEEADFLLATSPLSDGEVSIMQPLIEIDSHRAVRVLLELEPIIGFSVPETTIKRGGYTSFEAMNEHLVAKLKSLFAKESAKWMSEKLESNLAKE